jgi:hypothetical protein
MRIAIDKRERERGVRKNRYPPPYLPYAMRTTTFILKKKA